MAATMAAKGERAYAAKIPLMPARYEAMKDAAIAEYGRVGFLDTFVSAYRARWPSMITNYKDKIKPGLEAKWRRKWTSKMFGHEA